MTQVINSNEFLISIYEKGKERAITQLKQKFLQEKNYVKLAKLDKILKQENVQKKENGDK